MPAPNPDVAKTENLLLGNATAALANLSFSDNFPTRPSYGTKGTGIVLWANYFTLDPSSKLVLHQYSLSVKPAPTGKKLAQVVRLFLETPELQEFRHDLVTDFKSTLIARLKIENQSITVPYRAEGEDEPLPNPMKYIVKLELTRNLPVADLISYLTSTNLTSHYGEKLYAVQALNILINHYAKSSSKIENISSSKNFSLVDADTYDLETGLKAMRGFFTSVRAATSRMLLNVNVSHAAFYQEIPLDALIRVFLGQNNPARLVSFLKRLRIKVTHLKEKKNKAGSVIIRAKTICGLATPDDGSGLDHPPHVANLRSGPKEVKFWLEQKPPSTPKGKAKHPAGGQYISVFDYFKNSKHLYRTIHHRTLTSVSV